MKKTIRNIEHFLENYIYRYRILICLVISICVTELYMRRYISDIKDNLGNLVALLSAVLVVVTLILTVLLYLNDKDRYKRAMNVYGTNSIYQYVFCIVLSDITCIIMIILIGVLSIKVEIIKRLIAFFSTFIFCYALIGTLYVLWFAIDIVGNIDKKMDSGMS